MSGEASRWSQPFAALLGAYDAQMKYGLPSIGGKDSMSGTFNDIDVPPTLVSFAVDVSKSGNIVTPELKNPGDRLVRFRIPKDEYDLPVYEKVMEIYDQIMTLMSEETVTKTHGHVTAQFMERKIVAAYALDAKGVAAAISKMAFGNGFGVAVDSSYKKEALFDNGIGDIVAEMSPEEVHKLKTLDIDFEEIGTVTADGVFSYGSMKLSREEALRAWTSKLDKVFPYTAGKDKSAVASDVYHTDSVYVCRHKVARPTVFIPVFPGTNCEDDSAKAFQAAGADVTVKVFKNMTAEDIRQSMDVFEKAINQAQIIMFPGGFSAGDEPDGSAKFFATAFQNEKIKEAVMKLINERDGLALGICNGFQALIKLGLVPYGEIVGQKEDSPTLTFNTVNRHISKMAYLKVVSNKSPWLVGAQAGQVYVNPASHGEGRFVAPKEWIDKLFANGQVATQYADPEGNVSMDEEWNINGSYAAIEGITSPDGRILGKMVHAERRGEAVAINIFGEQDMKIFESGVKYFQ